jgi:hypothetical protein
MGKQISLGVGFKALLYDSVPLLLPQARRSRALLERNEVECSSSEAVLKLRAP